MRSILSRLSLYIGMALLCTLCACINDGEDLERGTIDLEVGDQLPDFTVMMDDSTLVSTKDLYGTCSMVVFFHTQCPDCQNEFPILQRLYEACPYPVKMVCISRKESAASIQKYWEQQGLTLPYAAQTDADIYHLFASSLIPRIYLSDAQGTIRSIYTDHPLATYEDLLTDIKNIVRK